jgi:hypothetical protein
MAAPPGYISALPNVACNNEAARRFLTANQWPPGFQTLLLEECEKIPLRFFICDDSGSMYENDGQHVVSSLGKHKAVNCSRYV